MTRAERILKFRQNLNRLYIPIYDFLSENLPEEWAPFSGYRSVEEQDALFNQGRSNPGQIVTNARGGDSPHNYGCASDWTIFVQEKPVWTLPKSELSLYGDMVWKAGGSWGGDFKSFKDRPHNELSISKRWSEINDTRIEDGMKAAIKLIESVKNS